MTEDFEVKVKVSDDPEDHEMISVEKKDDGFYINCGDGFQLYEANTGFNERDIRQFLNMDFNLDYGGSPAKLEKYK